MEVDAPAGGAAAARALALALYDAGEALQAAQDAARELLATQPVPPLAVDTETILHYARLLGKTSHAPFGWPDNTPAVEARRHTAAMYAQLLPPLPTEAQLQASLLHAQPPLPSHGAPAPAAQAEARTVAAQPPPGVGDVAELLRNWRPGDPLPKGLPPMPPGWKPGDPLPFAMGRVPAPAEDTRFVPRVALEELNPDLEFEVMGEDEYAMSDDDDDDDDDD